MHKKSEPAGAVLDLRELAEFVWLRPTHRLGGPVDFIEASGLRGLGYDALSPSLTNASKTKPAHKTTEKARATFIGPDRYWRASHTVATALPSHSPTGGLEERDCWVGGKTLTKPLFPIEGQNLA